MTLSIENREVLIKFRLEQSHEAINDVLLLIANQRYRAATNRIYYGMFYALLALALKTHFYSSKHNQLIGWFNKNFIHSDKMDKRFSKILTKAFLKRSKGDYETNVEFTKEEIDKMFIDLKDFVHEIESLITRLSLEQ